LQSVKFRADHRSDFCADQSLGTEIDKRLIRHVICPAN
jgi:hypothetical protein